MRETRTEKLDKSRFAVYLAKAKNFRLQMEEAMRSPNFDSVAVLGIHCAISASDAVAVYYLGERGHSAGNGKGEAVVDDIEGQESCRIRATAGFRKGRKNYFQPCEHDLFMGGFKPAFR